MWLITHRRYFVSVENECYAAAAVVQMAAVWLALGGYMWRWRSNHWTNPPLMTRGGEAGEVAMLQTFLSSWTGLVTARWLEPARTATTQHLVLQGQNIHLDVRQHSHCHFFLASLVTMLKCHVGAWFHMKAFSFMLLEIFLLWTPLNLISIVNSKTQNGKANNRTSIKPSKNSTSPGICSKVRKKSTLKAKL